jgi:peptidoglycan DL-endopeptidase CwlO
MATASLAAIPLAAAPQAASAGSRAPRLAAYLWAYHHTAGHAYCWAGAGPSCYDCSGVVMAAYAREGIRFGRSTTAMLGSGRLVRETERQARRGDLAFYGSGHVEFFIRPGHTFGALDAGTRIGWHHWSAYWHPTMFFRVRGAG